MLPNIKKHGKLYFYKVFHQNKQSIIYIYIYIDSLIVTTWEGGLNLGFNGPR